MYAVSVSIFSKFCQFVLLRASLMFDIAVSVKYRFCMLSGFLFVSFFSSPIPKNIGKW